MKALALLVLGIALVDGLNPSTIAPALVLAVKRRGVVLVSLFTLGVFVPSLAAGMLVVVGPGQALIDLIPHIGPHAKHLIEIGAGIALAGLAWILWIHRRRVAGGMSRDLPGGALGAAGLGAGIILAELPTAFPYFAALAAIVGSSADARRPTRARRALQRCVHPAAARDPRCARGRRPSCRGGCWS